MINQKGQSLIEVLVALAIALITATAFISLSAVTVRNSNSSTNEAHATQLAQQGIEKMIALRDQNGYVDSALVPWTSIFTSSPSYPQNCSDISTVPTAALPSPCGSGDFILSQSCTRGSVCLVRASPIPTGYLLPNDINFAQLIRITEIAGGDPSTAKNVTSLVWWSDASGVHKSTISRIMGKDKFQ